MWIDCSDEQQSTLSFLRRGKTTGDLIVVGCNFTPIPRHGYRIGVPAGGQWHEVLNSDAPLYGGSGLGNYGGTDAVPMPYEEYSHSLTLTLPPLAAVFFKPD